MSTRSDKQKTSSPDYPSLARKLLEASGDFAPSKLAPGLYIVATPIGHLGDISLRALWTLSKVDVIACEDTRLSGGMLSKYAIKGTLLPYHDHNADAQRPLVLKRIEAGEAVALISDAGMPLIADPGFKLVRACQDAGLSVTVIPGANAAVTALAGSGIATDKFLFAGFLPNKSAARLKAIAELREIPGSLIFYESPQRLADCLEDLAKGLGETRLATVARELTKMFEESRRGTLSELAGHYKDQDVKGEITIVVAGPAEGEKPVHDLDALLRDHMTKLSFRDAVASVSAVTGVKKSEVYAHALKLAPKITPQH